MTVDVKGWQDLVTAGAVAVMGRRPLPARSSRARGFSLIEMLIAMLVLGVLVAMGIPRFQLSLEQARANVAGANLQAIWSAQRLYWLQNRIYATDLPTLQDANPSSPLIDPSLTPPPPPPTTASYTYSVVLTESGFTATAFRNGSSSWSGSWTIDQNGLTGGSILQGGQATTIVLGFQ